MKPLRTCSLLALSALLPLLIGATETTFLPGSWQAVHTGLGDSGFHTVSISKTDPDLFLMASEENLYRSLDGGKSWQQIFHVAESRTIIRHIEPHPLNVNRFYLLTSDGIYISSDQGQHWLPSHIGIHSESRNVQAIAFHPRDRSQILLGTTAGLYLSENGGESWNSIVPELSEKAIVDVEYQARSKGLAYAVTENEIYRVNLTLQYAEKVFEFSGQKIEEITNSPAQFQEESDSGADRPLKHIASDDAGYSIFAAGDEGLIQSVDKGATWTINDHPDGINDLLISPFDDTLYLASRKGVFALFSGDRTARELYKGLPTSRVHALALSLDVDEHLFALTSDGLYRLSRISGYQPTEVMPVPDTKEIFATFSGWISIEPSIVEVQQMAVKYGNVTNGKTKNWHRQSRLSALLPVFSIDADWSTDSNVDLDRGNTNEKDVFIVGPEEIAFNWGLGFDWDLKRFIWSSDQTSIDVREKLMVELRESLLREVTRLYFERRRLQMEIVSAQNPDFTSRLDTLNRINELAAQIDALTGQYLSNRWQPPENYLPVSDHSESREIHVDNR
ncbi:MAG: hypothetical protein HY587_01260 [Candidatus Omnitrophica bacterium]|nr:hypothetical protein [Candidatus Omnitrophota bacterium]